MYTRKQLPSIVARRFAQLHAHKFYNGMSCAAGHTKRYTSSGNCAECCKAMSLRSYYTRKALFSEPVSP